VRVVRTDSVLFSGFALCTLSSLVSRQVADIYRLIALRFA
jgi:hypothetical protein